jgi:hypothetical protein
MINLQLILPFAFLCNKEEPKCNLTNEDYFLALSTMADAELSRQRETKMMMISREKRKEKDDSSDTTQTRRNMGPRFVAGRKETLAAPQKAPTTPILPGSEIRRPRRSLCLAPRRPTPATSAGEAIILLARSARMHLLVCHATVHVARTQFRHMDATSCKTASMRRWPHHQKNWFDANNTGMNHDSGIQLCPEKE